MLKSKMQGCDKGETGALEKTIVMVGGGIQEAPAVERLREWGYNIVVTDMNPDAPGAKLADYHICASASDVQTIATWIIHNKEKLNICGIFTLISQALTTALIASICQLPSLQPRTVLLADNKLLMKRRFMEMGIPTPLMVEVGSWSELEMKIKEFSYPCLLKASDSFGGRGVVEISNESDLRPAWEEVMNVAAYKTFILEEKVTGEFIDAQGFIENGNIKRAGDCNSYFTTFLDGTGQINPIETLNIAPAQHDEKVMDSVYSLLVKCACVFDINWGPIGADFILTENGLQVIEITPRLHGPNGTLWIFQLASEINPLKYLVETVCGERPDKSLLIPRRDSIGICKVFVGKKGKLRHIHMPESEYIVHQNIYAQPGKEYNTHGNYYSGSAAAFFQVPDLKTGQEQLKILEENFVYEVG